MKLIFEICAGVEFFHNEMQLLQPSWQLLAKVSQHVPIRHRVGHFCHLAHVLLEFFKGELSLRLLVCRGESFVDGLEVLCVLRLEEFIGLRMVFGH